MDTRVELFININSNFNFENIFQIFEKSDVDSNIKIWIDAWDLFKTLFQFFWRYFQSWNFYWIVENDCRLAGPPILIIQSRVRLTRTVRTDTFPIETFFRTIREFFHHPFLISATDEPESLAYENDRPILILSNKNMFGKSMSGKL